MASGSVGPWVGLGLTYRFGWSVDGGSYARSLSCWLVGPSSSQFSLTQLCGIGRCVLAHRTAAALFDRCEHGWALGFRCRLRSRSRFLFLFRLRGCDAMIRVILFILFWCARQHMVRMCVVWRIFVRSVRRFRMRLDGALCPSPSPRTTALDYLAAL